MSNKIAKRTIKPPGSSEGLFQEQGKACYKNFLECKERDGSLFAYSWLFKVNLKRDVPIRIIVPKDATNPVWKGEVFHKEVAQASSLDSLLEQIYSKCILPIANQTISK